MKHVPARPVGPYFVRVRSPDGARKYDYPEVTIVEWPVKGKGPLTVRDKEGKTYTFIEGERGCYGCGPVGSDMDEQEARFAEQCRKYRNKEVWTCPKCGHKATR